MRLPCKTQFMTTTTPSYKVINQKWDLWDCPDEPFTFDKEVFRFVVNKTEPKSDATTTTVKILPSYTLLKEEQSVFASVYELEYDVTLLGAGLEDSLVKEMIEKDAYPAFVEAFNKQKAEFEAAKELPVPAFDSAIT